VEMLVERGAQEVRCLDIVPPPPSAWRHPNIQYVVGDICDVATVDRIVDGADCVWHNAAAVGPFHPRPLYFKVNYDGTANVLRACKKAGVRKLVMSSSPSTRFDGTDVDGLTEEQMPKLPQKRYLQVYAETKAMGEVLVTGANCADIMTCAVAPHQVYGPRDNLFLPNLLETAGSGMLRVFGNGRNRICFTYVDNYAHGLILAEHAMQPGSACLGKFYIVTDAETHPYKEGYSYFWEVMEEAASFMGFASITARTRLPLWLLLPIAFISEFIGWLLGVSVKLTFFNVKMLTMHRWFDTSAAARDLGYSPIVSYRDGWSDTLQWFKQHWLPTFARDGGMIGIAAGTQNKIDVQAAGTKKGD